MLFVKRNERLAAVLALIVKRLNTGFLFGRRHGNVKSYYDVARNASMKSLSPDEWKELFILMERTLLDVGALTKDEVKPKTAISSNKLFERQQEIVEKINWAQKLPSPHSLSDQQFWDLVYPTFFAAGTGEYKGNKWREVLDEHVKPYWNLQQPIWDAAKTKTKGTLYIFGTAAQDLLNELTIKNAPSSLHKTISVARFLQTQKALTGAPSFISLFLAPHEDEDDLNVLKRVYASLRNMPDVNTLITPFHMMADLGFRVVKPDIHVVKVAIRLGIIKRFYHNKDGWIELRPQVHTPDARTVEYNSDLWDIQNAFRQIQPHTGRSMREIDMLMFFLGKRSIATAPPFVRSICNERNNCNLCFCRPYCDCGQTGGILPNPNRTKKKQPRNKKALEAV